MSPKVGLVLALAIGVVLLRAAMSGKLQRAFSALTGPSTKSMDTGLGSSGGGAGASSVVSGAAGNPSSEFGFTPSSIANAPPQYWAAGPNSPDAGVQGDVSHEYNLFTGGQSVPLTLPGGESYTLESQYNATGVGGIETWRDPFGGLFSFLHLQQLSPFHPGQIVPGGSVVGMTGWPTDPAYGNGVAGPQNAHLAVIVDPTSQATLGFTPGAYPTV